MKPNHPIQKIALVSPNPRIPDVLNSAIGCENALVLIGTVLRDHGYDVEVYVERIAPIEWERIFAADLVGFSAVSCSVNRAAEMAAKIKEVRNVPTILGGPHASLVPDDAVQHFDYVVRDEGEATVIDLIHALNRGMDLSKVKGISYFKNGKSYHNPAREYLPEFGTIADLSLIQEYNKLKPWKLFLQGKYHMHFVETSRGCPYPCKFCWRIGMKTVRHRSFIKVVEDLKTKAQYVRGIPNIVTVVDSYFGVDKRKTKELLKEIIASGFKGELHVFARCEVAGDIELIRLMKKAGVKWIFMGIESINDENLEYFDKRQTVDDVTKALKIIRKHGIYVTASIILGSDVDTQDAYIRAMEFCKKHDVTWIMFNILTDLPYGQERTIPQWRIFQRNWDYYNGMFVNHFPKNIRPSELQQQLYDGYRSHHSLANIWRNLFRGKISTTFYLIFRGLTMRPIYEEIRSYIPQLKKIEQGLYDENGYLIEDKLVSFREPGIVPSPVPLHGEPVIEPLVGVTV
ncbi:MAG: B12-binding domain-containing radical SAM protein [Deltaproteobacteria bacterium]|nr:B12-binding domain-containing radical SAM protein [Deltaproteobacteria bacterium]